MSSNRGKKKGKLVYKKKKIEGDAVPRGPPEDGPTIRGKMLYSTAQKQKPQKINLIQNTLQL